MHYTHLFKNIFQYLEEEERSAAKRITKMHISLSEFGGISEEHFKEQYRRESRGTRWQALNIEIRKVPYGQELEITRLDFE